MKRTYFLILYLCIPLCLSGCWDQQQYEKLGFVLQMSIETSQDKGLLISYVSPVVDPNSKENIEMISANVPLIRGAREAARRISSKKPVGGMIQQLLISDFLAEKGLHNLMEVYQREPSTPTIPYIVITEGSPKHIMGTSQNWGDKPLPGFYIHELIANNIEFSYVPDTTILSFDSKFFSPGIDPIAPLIKMSNDKGKGVEVIGCALFSEDKLVGKLNPRKTSMLLALMGEMKKTQYLNPSIGPEPLTSNNEGIAITLKLKKRKINVKIANDKPIVDIFLNFTGRLNEYHWNTLYNSYIETTLEDQLSKAIKDECIEVLNYTQEVNSDPLGVGDIIRAKHKEYWKTVNWNNEYNKIAFHVNVNVNIIGRGIIR
ncbi:MAG: Ger(x)C family spore germination protein [Bacillota bacterium]|nr:Ger(x)C family spore germination protein [Bacillota bacterium]